MALVGVTANPAEAAPIQLGLSDGTTTVIIEDGGIGDSNPLDGVITWVGSIGGWLINVSTGNGIPTVNFMDLNSINQSNPGTGTTLTVAFSQIDITLAALGYILEFGGTTTNASVVYSAFFDPLNNFFGGSSFASLGPFTGAFSGTTAGLIGAGSPYSLTQAFFITPTDPRLGAAFSGDGELNAVPEPGSLALLGGGLLGLASWARRRRQQKKSA
jgi:hypothetical protein